MKNRSKQRFYVVVVLCSIPGQNTWNIRITLLFYKQTWSFGVNKNKRCTDLSQKHWPKNAEYVRSLMILRIPATCCFWFWNQITFLQLCNLWWLITIKKLSSCHYLQCHPGQTEK